MSRLEEAKQFRKTFGQEILPDISRFGFIKTPLWKMQLNLIKEEASEFLVAADEVYADPEKDRLRSELLKELSDLVFVCYQFAATYNLDLDEALRRVYESNMSKLDEQGKVIYREDGKVLKGEGYKEPNLNGLFPPSNTLYDTHGK